jgi:eukaryotic-like serine/threonine-protein kinase
MYISAGIRLGPYEILAPLGAGGMGEVYRARDTRLDREVAVKVLPTSAREDRDARTRFRREALALSRLNHPNIEMVLDFGEDGGVDYMVLEFVPGETLAARLARGRIPEREAAELGAQVAEALSEAHERGVLHRDLKPGNIMVTPKGRVKVLDFGLAKLAQVPSDETRSMDVTQAGTAPGTLAYMAPEQLLGTPIDARTDLYALGVALYEMTTAQRPFQAGLATALANEVLHGRLAPPRAHEPLLSARAEAIILRAMERESARRYQTAGEMLGELRRLAAAEAGSSGEASPTAAPAERRVTSIAVLPLENLSGDPGQEYFSDGMTEELIACLAQVRALRIISRTSVMRYKGQRKAISDIARELNVDAVVEGSVRRAGDRVRITVQLIDASAERHLWGKSYERDVTEVLGLQGEVAAAIVEEIQVSVTPQEQTRLRDARAVNPEAYEAYLKGRYLIERRTDESLRQGLESLNEAVRLDPALELAHVGVADAYNLMGFMTVRPPREVFPQAQAAARRALEINPVSAEALTSLAYAMFWHDWNVVESERLFRRSIDLNPKYSQAHLWFTNLLLACNRMDEARAEAQIARTLDPVSNIAIVSAGWYPFFEGRFEESVRKLREAAHLIPEFGPVHYWMGLVCAAHGLDAEAMAALDRCLAILGRTPMVLAALAMVHARAGRAAEARTVLAELEALSAHRYVAAYFFAQVRAVLGDLDEALHALEMALEERVHFLTLVRLDPAFTTLRGDPRFEVLAARVTAQ